MEQKELEYYLSQVRRIAEHREKGAMLKIRKTFKALLRDLKHFVSDEYADLAENDELTFEILNRKRQYARFIEEAVAVVDKYYPDALKQTTDIVEQTYQLVYNGMIDSVEKCSTTAELDEAFKGVKAATPQQIRAAVMNPITKITVPDTYAKDRANYIYDLKRELNTGLLNGDRYSTMAKRIVDRTEIAYRRAECIVRTETHRVREQGFCDSAVEINQTLEQGETSMRMVKTWCTMEDERVRGGKKGQKANHRKMNGVSVPIDEKFDLGRGIKTMCPGSSGDAANDINCRCFLVHELKDISTAMQDIVNERSDSKITASVPEWQEHIFELDVDDKLDILHENIGASETMKISQQGEEAINNRLKQVFEYSYTKKYDKKIYHHVNSEGLKYLNSKMNHTHEEIEIAKREYVKNLNSFTLNKALREDKKLTNSQIEGVKVLNSLISKNKLPHDMALIRYADDKYAEAVLGVDIKDVLKNYKDCETALDKFKGVNITEKSFLSTSSDPNKNVFANYPVQIEMYADKGTHAYITDNIDETEVIFATNTKYEILGFERYVRNKKQVLKKMGIKPNELNIDDIDANDLGLKIIVKIKE